MKKQTPETLKKKKRQYKKKKELAGSRVKLSFKKHFLPPLAGLVVAILIFGFFNSQLLSGQIAYYLYQRNANSEGLGSELAASPVDKNAPPKLIIGNINVSAPVIFDVPSVSESLFQKALQNGVVHYPGTARPGQLGNVVIFGHSSGQWWAPGDYKFVFTLLDKLKSEDRIYLEYQGVRYIYRVYNSSVVEPTDLTPLNQGNRHTLTLITCTPVGTSAKRLIISARQVVPAVADHTQSARPVTRPAEVRDQLPSNSSSFWRDFVELF